MDTSDIPMIFNDQNPDHQSLFLQHSLNKEKQVQKLITNSSRDTINIEINNCDENINIDCSPGFFNLVVRPSLLAISEGFHIACKGTVFELRSITAQKDNNGTVQSTVVKFVLMIDPMQRLTVCLHHTTQRVQVQGGSVMSD